MTENNHNPAERDSDSRLRVVDRAIELARSTQPSPERIARVIARASKIPDSSEAEIGSARHQTTFHAGRAETHRNRWIGATSTSIAVASIAIASCAMILLTVVPVPVLSIRKETIAEINKLTHPPIETGQIERTTLTANEFAEIQREMLSAESRIAKLRQQLDAANFRDNLHTTLAELRDLDR